DAHAFADRHAEALVHRDAEAREHGDELGVRADAGAARGEVVSDPLEHLDLPAQVVQQVGGEQAAERAADDQRTLRHYLEMRKIGSVPILAWTQASRRRRALGWA